MSQDEMEKAFLAAAEIAKKLPKNLQEVGFQRALDQLVGGQPVARVPLSQQRSPRADGGPKAASPTAELLGKINRTAYPDMGATARVADRALKVLHLAHQDHGVDGLTAADIAEILSQKFRLPVKANSVTKALERETNTVDLRSGPGGSRMFHIMVPGEDYLKSLREGGTLPEGSRPAKSGPRRRQARSPEAREEVTPKSPKERGKPSAPRKAKGRPGPKASVTQLIEGGFFRSARTIAQIQEELRHRRGHSYSVQELAPALVRSVRDGSLARGRNQTGQYEYTAA